METETLKFTPTIGKKLDEIAKRIPERGAIFGQPIKLFQGKWQMSYVIFTEGEGNLIRATLQSIHEARAAKKQKKVIKFKGIRIVA